MPIIEKLEVPELNVELLQQCVDFAIGSYESTEIQEISWNQNDWSRASECGTSFCAAGYAAFISGFTEVIFRWRKEGTEVTELCYGNCCTSPEKEGEYNTPMQLRQLTNLDKVFGPDYQGPIESSGSRYWEWAGRTLLGLTEVEAAALFNGDNDIKDLCQTAMRIATSAGKGSQLMIPDKYLV